MSLKSGERIGPYEVTGKLGAGGMGEVHDTTGVSTSHDHVNLVLDWQEALRAVTGGP